VRREIVVNAPIAQAFAKFVDRFGDFKPKEHNLLGAPIISTTFEARVGRTSSTAQDAASATGRGARL